MFELIFFSFFSIFIITPCGYFFTKNNNQIVNLSNHLIYGIILISFITLVINFFFPLNIIVNSCILILPLLIILKNYKFYFSLNFLKFAIFNTIIIFLLVAKSNIYRPDAILYHLSYTGILNNEKIIFGLSNLHFRFAHISIIQYFSAFFNNIIFETKGIVIAIALVSSAVIINFLSHLLNYLKTKNYNFHFFFLLSLLIYIGYKMNRYGEFGNDAPTHFLFFFLISEILLHINKEKENFVAKNLILASFIVLNKITMAFALFLPIIFISKKNIKKEFKIKKNYLFLILLLPWFLKNIIISGCLIYPVEKLCFQNLEWTNIDQVKMVSEENEAWTKSWPDFKNPKQISQKEYSSNFNWIETWSKNHLKKIIEILLPYLIFLLIIFLIIFKYKTKDISNNKFDLKRYKLLIFLMMIFSLIWFLKVPVYRYGYSYFISLFALLFAFMCTYKKTINDKLNFFFKILIIFISTIFISKNIMKIVITKEENKKIFPELIFIDKSDFKEIKLNKFIYYESNKMCGYTVKPCSHYKDLKLKHKKIYNYSVLTRFN